MPRDLQGIIIYQMLLLCSCLFDIVSINSKPSFEIAHVDC